MFKPIKIRHYLKLMQARGFAAEAVLVGSGLSAARLLDSGCLISLEQTRTVVRNMIELCGEQGIGLEIGGQTEFIDLGLVGHAMVASRTVREATECWIRFSSALVGMLVRVEIEDAQSQEWSLRLDEMFPMGFIYNFCVEECLVMIHKLAEQIVEDEKPPALKRLELSYPAPAHHERYAQYFACPIQFNARATRISFDNLSLDLPLRGYDAEAHGVITQQCRLALRRIGIASPYASRVNGILSRMPAGIPALGEIARELNVSERTLRRRLKDEGQNFQALLNQSRVALARDYLRSSPLPAKEIGFLLGFQDANSFYRAFKQWTGETVEDFRREAG